MTNPAAHAKLPTCPLCFNPMSEREWLSRRERGGVCPECAAMRAEYEGRRQVSQRGEARARYGE
jgi:hypothetical protein